MNRKDLMVAIDDNMKEPRYHLTPARDYMEQVNAVDAREGMERQEWQMRY